jgi:tetraacyldisaccharide 4'-kinase
MNRLHAKLGQYWYPVGPLARTHPFLFTMGPLALLYGMVVAVRNRLYDRGILKQVRLSCPVISIGNITVGGTGKTPLTVLTAQGMKARGFRPAVLSRGYGGRLTTSGNIVSDGTSLLLNSDEAGDEPVLIAAAAPGVPVLTGPDRGVSGRLAIEKFGADILILDDAFQYRRLFRDVNIVLLDQDRPFGNRRLLPAGPLREPPAALKRADIIVVTGVARGEEERDKPAGPDSIPLFRARYQALAIMPGKDQQPLPPTTLRGKRIIAFTGIAAPDKFRATLEELGATIIKFLAFPDHYFYKQEDVEAIAGDAKALHAELVLTTEKDGVKLLKYPYFYRTIMILMVGLQLDPEEKTYLDTIGTILRR